MSITSGAVPWDQVAPCGVSRVPWNSSFRVGGALGSQVAPCGVSRTAPGPPMTMGVGWVSNFVLAKTIRRTTTDARPKHTACTMLLLWLLLLWPSGFWGGTLSLIDAYRAMTALEPLPQCRVVWRREVEGAQLPLTSRASRSLAAARNASLMTPVVFVPRVHVTCRPSQCAGALPFLGCGGALAALAIEGNISLARPQAPSSRRPPLGALGATEHSVVIPSGCELRLHEVVSH